MVCHPPSTAPPPPSHLAAPFDWCEAAGHGVEKGSFFSFTRGSTDLQVTLSWAILGFITLIVMELFLVVIVAVGGGRHVRRAAWDLEATLSALRWPGVSGSAATQKQLGGDSGCPPTPATWHAAPYGGGTGACGTTRVQVHGQQGRSTSSAWLHQDEAASPVQSLVTAASQTLMARAHQQPPPQQPGMPLASGRAVSLDAFVKRHHVRGRESCCSGRRRGQAQLRAAESDRAVPAAGAVCEGAEPGPITSARHPRAGAAATGAGGAIDEDSDGAQPGLLGLSDSKEAESDARAHVALASEAPAAPQPQPPPPQQPPSLEELEACRLLLLRLIDVLRHSEEYLELFGVPLEPKFRSSLLSFVLTLAAAGLGVDAAVAASVRSLDVSSSCGFPTLCACASVLGGRLPNVTSLDLDLAGDGDWRQGDASVARLAYTALRAALPKLESLRLPCTPGLLGLEAFAGSGLTSVQSSDGCGEHANGVLERGHVRGLAKLTQLRHLRLCLCKSEADHHDWQAGGGAGVDDGDAPPPAADEDDAATLAGLAPCYREQLLSLRLLLCTAPAALETLEILKFEMQGGPQGGPQGGRLSSELVFRFTPTAAAGRSAVAAVEVHEVEGAASLNYLAAAVLPRLAATGQRRLPLLRLGHIKVYPRGLAQMLSQPQRPFVRLAAMCDRLELGTLTLLGAPASASPPPVADALAAVRDVVQLFGWPSQQLCVWLHPWAFRLSMRGAWDGAADGGGGSSASGGVAAAPASASASASSPALSLATVTAEQLLRATAARLCMAATEVGAAGSDDLQTGRDEYQRWVLLLLQGPLVKQLACGRSGHAMLRAWLTDVAAGLDDGSLTAGAAKIASSAFVPTEALALAQCSEPKHAPLLARAVVAAGRLAPGSLLQELWGSRREAAAHGAGADAAGGGGNSASTAGAQEQRQPSQRPDAGAAALAGRRGATAAAAAAAQADAADFEALQRLFEGALQIRRGAQELHWGA
ncbi:hypothetical protein HXX76_006525 [Chlamydomonas incerta]|uniref:Uncharacterized protein n=1 Tax=Chlamydomonas incerta TaxID=51695 RepID=A0A835W3S5_CHLIN|nr:hypothetical protein HXX76_006525 [Chlamydomonas incerta]|eukprot:KAG2436213.1 hypothetical protein HXX76_006525 [Chlamydomonas incerta]